MHFHFISVEAFAKNEYLETRSSGIQTVTMYWEPVADGVGITVNSKPGKLFEDQIFGLNVSYSAIDTDGSETIGEKVYIQFEDRSIEIMGYSLKEGPTVIYGTTLTWYYEINAADLNTLQIVPPVHWHGVLKGSIFMGATETLSPNPSILSKGTFAFNVVAVADAPLLTGPTTTIFVQENEQVALPGLNAVIIDTVTVNGAEVMGLVFEGVPLDSFFVSSAGVQVGAPSTGNTWTLTNPAELADIQFVPPPYWSGTLTLNLTATVIETSNGNTAVEYFPFDIVIEPVASEFEILTQDVNLPATGSADLSLNIIMLDTRGTDVGENPAEIIELTFTNVPASTFLRGRLGGRLKDKGAGIWTFTGSQEQANSIQIVNSNAVANTYFVKVAGKTLDAGTELATAILDDFDFRVFVNAIGTPGVVLTATGSNLGGTGGNDILYATAIANQSITGGLGMDVIYSAPERKIMSGGSGADQFVWRSITDIQGSLDEISDFSRADGDQLNLGGLIPSFDTQMDNVAEFVRLVDASPDSIVQIKDGNTWKPVVRLANVNGVSAQELWDAGNLLL